MENPSAYTAAERVRGQMRGAFSEARRQLFGMGFWKLYGLVLVAAAVQNGIWFSPQTPLFLLISKDIFKNPFVGHAPSEWVLSSFLGPVLGYATRMNGSLLAYSLLHFGIFLAGFTALTWAARKRSGDFAARTMLMVFFLSPLSNITFTWLGSPDILTMLLSMTIVVFWRNWAVLAASSMLLGMNHPEQGMTIVLLLMIFDVLRGGGWRAAAYGASGLAGVAAGAGLVQWFFAAHNFDIVYTRLDYVLATGAAAYIKSTLSQPFALLFSLFGTLLPFIAVRLKIHGQTSREALAFATVTGLALLGTLLALDPTRVFAALTFPVLLLLVLEPGFSKCEGKERELFENVLTACVIAGLLIPRFTVMNGNVNFSAYPSIIGSIMQSAGAALR